MGENVQSPTYTDTHAPKIVIVGLGGGCFHINVNFERKVKGASALYCVYILKNKVLYVFITLIIVIKPAIFNMWFGEFFVCFSCLGVLFVFVFLGGGNPCF